MSSLCRILSARANGALSRGPSTPEGKRRSAQNAIRHGLLSECVVLPGESVEGFAELLSQHVERFDPADGVEFGMIEEMAAAYCRLRRASWRRCGPHHRRFPQAGRLPGVSAPAPLRNPPPPHVSARAPQHPLVAHRRHAKRTQSHFRTVGSDRGARLPRTGPRSLTVRPLQKTCFFLITFDFCRLTFCAV